MLDMKLVEILAQKYYDECVLCCGVLRYGMFVM